MQWEDIWMQLQLLAAAPLLTGLRPLADFPLQHAVRCDQQQLADNTGLARDASKLLTRCRRVKF